MLSDLETYQQKCHAKYYTTTTRMLFYPFSSDDILGCKYFIVRTLDTNQSKNLILVSSYTFEGSWNKNKRLI